MASPDYVIYTRQDPPCIWCQKAKALLASKGLDFEERDIYDIYEREAFVVGAPVFVPQIYYKGFLIGGFERLKWRFEDDTQ